MALTQRRFCGVLNRVSQIPRRLRVFLAQPRNIQRVGIILTAFFSGLVAVSYAKLYKVAEIFATDLWTAHPVWLCLGAPVLFAAGWWSVYRYEPFARGSGIPQVMTAIEIEDERPGSAAKARLLGMRVALIKMISSLFCTLGGGGMGREGPTLQVSASIFYAVGARVRRFTRIGSMESWMLAGSAAGLAAAFNTPLGGIVYAIEELASKHFARVRTTVLTSVLVSGLVSQWLVGSYLYLGFPRIGKVNFDVIPMAFLIGIGGGLIGGVFGVMLFRGRGVLERRLHGKRAVVGLIIAVICGFGLVGLRFVDARSLGPGNRLVSHILAGDTAGSALLVLVRMGSTIVSYMSGNGGGVFAPALAVGASFGSWVSSWVPGLNGVLLSLLGMIAVLTGLTRTPFTSFVLILEMTDRHSAIFPMMLTAIVAYGSARLVGGATFNEHTKHAMLRQLARERRAARRRQAEEPAPAAPPPTTVPGQA